MWWSRTKSPVMRVVMVCAGVLFFAVGLGLFYNWVSRPAIVVVADDKLLSTYTQKYKPIPEIHSVSVSKKLVYLSKWVIVDIIFDIDKSKILASDDTEHLATKGTRCVYKVEGSVVSLLACSSEGFYASDFPDTTPSELVERANKPL